MKRYIVESQSCISTRKFTGALRWKGGVLQQEVHTEFYDTKGPTRYELEWKDVPQAEGLG